MGRLLIISRGCHLQYEILHLDLPSALTYVVTRSHASWRTERIDQICILYAEFNPSRQGAN